MKRQSERHFEKQRLSIIQIKQRVIRDWVFDVYSLDCVAELYKQVCEAKEVLMDEQKRAVYNKKYKAMLASKSRRENMDKRQREMTESLFAREEAGWIRNVF